ncbi:MAG: hypothetical protein DRP42_01670 [Tenericutes bacterium]|nr:MAG: hypothetical protein DRP42_01670 [Mycoplasmatota bacterium]
MAKKGNELEQKIWENLKLLNSDELGFFIKSPTPTKAVPINGEYKFVFSAKALCDFVGICEKKFVLIEVKEVSGPRFDVKRLKKHQLNQLRKIKSYGGISLVIFLIREYDKIYVLTVDQYDDIFLNLERKSIRIDTIVEKGIHLDTSNYLDLYYLLTT